MSSVLERPPTAPRSTEARVPTPAHRLGRLLAAVTNGGLLWVTHQLLDWGWPSFLTRDFELVLGLVTVTLAAGIVANLALALRHTERFRLVADLVIGGLGLAVALRMLELLPVDFGGNGHDWSWVVRAGLVVGVAVLVGVVVLHLIELLAGLEDDPRLGPASQSRGSGNAS